MPIFINSNNIISCTLALNQETFMNSDSTPVDQSVNNATSKIEQENVSENTINKINKLRKR